MSNCCLSGQKEIGPCEKMFITTDEIVLEPCSGQIVSLPIKINHVCCNMPITVGVIVYTDGDGVLGVVFEKLNTEPSTDCQNEPFCIPQLSTEVCIPIARNICEETILKYKVLVSYVPDEAIVGCC